MQIRNYKTPMKKQLVLCALAVATAFITATGALAQSANFIFSPTTLPSAAPGSTIQFNINLNVMIPPGGNPTDPGVQDVEGLTYFLQQTGAGPFVFAIVGRNTSASPFSDSQFPDSAFAPATPDALSGSGPTGSNSKDLGRLALSPMGSSPAGGYFVATITLSIAANAAPGTYTIQSVNTGGKSAVINDSNGDTFPIQPASITITVVPEPSTYALLAFAAVGAAVVVYRRRATA